MPIVKKSATVPYTPHQMFRLVDDIQQYPEFIPACVNAKILNRDEDEVYAQLDFSRSGFQKSFTTCNRLQPHKMIEIRLVNGPFKQLEGFWQFEENNEKQCLVSLFLEFEFSNKLLALAFGPLFNQVANKLVDVFCSRADQVYGDEKSAN